MPGRSRPALRIHVFRFLPLALLAAVSLATRAGDTAPDDTASDDTVLDDTVLDDTASARVELGRHLFYDPRLSVDGSLACSGCHRQELAFTDGRARAVGATGEEHPRSAMSLADVGAMAHLGWDDPELTRLEDQALVPLLNQHPVEMGLAGHEDAALARLRAEPVYGALFPAAFPDVPLEAIALDQVVQALAAFERTLVSRDSPFDRWLRDETTLPADARRGMRLFYSARLGCSGCHRGPDFAAGGEEFHNTGLYDLDGAGAYPAGGEGLFRRTAEPADMGRFRTPTLRNVAVTAPYMHDGSVATLAEVIALYARGGRTKSPLKDERLAGFELSDDETSDLLAFLDTLTDPGFLDDPRFASPWP